MITLFFSYSHKDEEFRNELETHLALLKRQGIVSSWHDRRITAGSDLNQTISSELESSQIVLLLVSANFLASDYCYEREMNRALEKHGDGSAVIIPVILHPCDWHSAPFGHLRATPTDGKPVSMYANLHEAFAIVAKDVRDAANAISTSSSAHAATRAERTEAQPVQERIFKEASEISARLKKVLALLNSAHAYDKLTISKIAQMSNSSTVGEIERIFNGIDEPSLFFLHVFSERFGVQEAWLLHGEHEPFYQPEPSKLHAFDYLPYIKKAGPEEVCFVRSKSKYGECLIVLKLDEWRYHVLDGVWHVSSHVGGTGTGQLVSLYKLIKTLCKEELNFLCGGQVLSEEDFSMLMNGKVFPGSLLSRPDENHDWWFAFPDLDHQRPSSKNYFAWYGQSFLDAQEVVREAIKAGNRAA